MNQDIPLTLGFGGRVVGSVDVIKQDDEGIVIEGTVTDPEIIEILSRPFEHHLSIGEPIAPTTDHFSARDSVAALVAQMSSGEEEAIPDELDFTIADEVIRFLEDRIRMRGGSIET